MNTVLHRMRRISLLLGVVLCSLCNASHIFAVEQPNILFAIADDWSVHAGVYGTRWVSTPNFDRIAAQGLLFHHAYTPAAKCATSRASILTGRNIWQLEEAGNHLSYFPSKFVAWPEVLQKSGWQVGMTGKGWGPGIALNQNNVPRQMTGKPFQSRKAKPPTKAISNTDYAANFVDFLDSVPSDKRWCFWYGATEPHRDYEFRSGLERGGKQLSDIDQVPKYWPDHETVRHDMLDYALEVEHFDDHLGRMLAELERRGELDNTLIIVTSDHGMPFPRVKGYAYYDSNHVPLAVRFPAGIEQPGRKIDDFVSFIDIAATVLDVAGVKSAESGMQPITGRSWRPIFESGEGGRVVAERDHVLIGKERNDVGRPQDVGYPIRGLVTADYLYLRNFEPDRWPAGNPETGYLDTDGSPTKTLILELGRLKRDDPFWRWNFGKRVGEEFYDLKSDSDCVNNLVDQVHHRVELEKMRELLFERLKGEGDPRMFGDGEIFDRYIPTNGAHFYEDYLLGKKPPAPWVSPSDFESP